MWSQKERNMRTVNIGLAALAVMLTLGQQPAAQEPVPIVFDFEADAAGSPPPNWLFNAPSQSGARVEVSGADHHSGAQALLITHGRATETSPATLIRLFDATPYRGKRVRYRFFAKVEDAAVLHLWLRVDLPGAPGAGFGQGFFDNMADRPITGREWREYVIVGDVDKDASRIVLGALAMGNGRSWIDSGALEIVGDA